MDINSLGGVSKQTVQSVPALASPPPPPSPASASAKASGAEEGHAAISNPTPEQIKQAVDNINTSLNETGNANSVQFSIDPDSKNVIVQVVDSQTKTVIRQIPSEDIIQMGRELGKKLGKVIDQQV